MTGAANKNYLDDLQLAESQILSSQFVKAVNYVFQFASRCMQWGPTHCKWEIDGLSKVGKVFLGRNWSSGRMPMIALKNLAVLGMIIEVLDLCCQEDDLFGWLEEKILLLGLSWPVKKYLLHSDQAQWPMFQNGREIRFFDVEIVYWEEIKLRAWIRVPRFRIIIVK